MRGYKKKICYLKKTMVKKIRVVQLLDWKPLKEKKAM
jgi:hypothetical protein